VGSVTAGWVALPHHGFSHFVVFGDGPGGHTFHWDVAIKGTCAGIIGVIGAWLIYHRRVWKAEDIKAKVGWLHTLLDNKYYFDEFYLFLVKRVQQGIAILVNWFEQNVLIKGIVNGLAALTRFIGDRLRRTQTGQLQTYVFLIVAGVTLIVYLSVVLPGKGG